MDVEFDSDDLERVYYDAQFTGGCSPDVVKRYRRTVGLIVAAKDERDLYQFKGMRFEKLKGKRKGQRSLRLNDQWRLIVEVRGQGSEKRIGVIEITDYH